MAPGQRNPRPRHSRPYGNPKLWPAVPAPGWGTLTHRSAPAPEGSMRHHSRVVRKLWDALSALAPPVAPQRSVPAPPLVSVVPSRLSPAHQRCWWAVLPAVPRAGLQALAALEDPDPSVSREGFPQGCDVPQRPVKSWARRRRLEPHRSCRAPSTSPKPKPRRNPQRHRDDRVHPAVAPLMAVPVRAPVGGPGARIGMIRHGWSSYGVVAQPVSNAPRFTSLASMMKM